MSDLNSNSPRGTELEDGAGTDEEVLAELRRLLTGPVQTQVEQLQHRLDDPRIHAKEVSRVLPDAIVYRSSEDRQLTGALAPTVEEVIRTAVKKDVKTFADALFPVMGPAIRRAIAEALRTMLQSLNEVLEHSFSWRGLQWRLEAFRSKRSFSEIVLLHSIIYSVEQVFLIHKETGLLLQHVVAEQVALQDPDMVSSMLRAIQDFVTDSFAVTEYEALHTIQVGELTVWLEQGSQAILACVIRGNAPENLKPLFQEVLAQIHLEQSDALEGFEGDVAIFEATRPLLRDCLETRYKPKERKTSPALIVGGALLSLLLIGWIVFFIRDRYRWTAFLEKLKDEPGIVVTDVTERDGKRIIVGLRDELAADPGNLLRETKLDAERIDFQWVPFQSLDAPFILERARRLLEPPAAVELKMQQDTLIATGSAPHDWIMKFRQAAEALPGVVRVSEEDLSDLDGQELSALNDYLEKLRAEPGIVVTSVERLAGKHFIAGLRDPLARNPLEILKETELNRSRVGYRWASYQAMEPQFILARANIALAPPASVNLRFTAGELIFEGSAPHQWIIDARKIARTMPGVIQVREDKLQDSDLERLKLLRDQLDRQLVLFPRDSVDLEAEEFDKIGPLVRTMQELNSLAGMLQRKMQIEIVGRTDSSGSELRNVKLRRDRADKILYLLKSQGLAANNLIAVGVGANEPLYEEKTEKERELNRSVSFRVKF